ncbi:hypothetical protein COCNU_14G008630 [Cocos nucifera]|uniref:Uncharacterized protein n=1 Tax=Cocos nucifera TaxID=13894 RepID=A0A8K0ND90_COCNU|nr:hypothetical protein COCNU_14G008630 [Cocos nucifera]
MAKSQAYRFATEVAPPQMVSVVRRKVSRILDTIKEEEREVKDNFSSIKSTPSLLFMRELEKSFSVHGQEWPGRNPSTSFT